LEGNPSRIRKIIFSDFVVKFQLSTSHHKLKSKSISSGVGQSIQGVFISKGSTKKSGPTRFLKKS
jgi:hypothetical protein